MKNYMDLTGRVAIVTGASSGLGYEYCKVFAENGAKVAAFARRKEKLEKLKEEIEYRRRLSAGSMRCRSGKPGRSRSTEGH